MSCEDDKNLLDEIVLIGDRQSYYSRSYEIIININ
jgi:hypothetical protein